MSLYVHTVEFAGIVYGEIRFHNLSQSQIDSIVSVIDKLVTIEDGRSLFTGDRFQDFGLDAYLTTGGSRGGGQTRSYFGLFEHPINNQLFINFNDAGGILYVNNRGVVEEIIAGKMDGNNVIGGSSLRDLVLALGGDDTIMMSDGNDYIYGGTGRDTITYENAHSKVTTDIDRDGKLTATGGYSGTDFFDSIEVIIGSSYDDTFRISGSSNRGCIFRLWQ